MCCGFRHRLISVMLVSAAFLTLCLASCAGMSEAAREKHEYSNAEFRQIFIEDSERCLSRGRMIIINGNGARLDRHGIPRSRVHYYCA